MFKNILVSAAVLALVDARYATAEPAFLSNQDKLVQMMNEESDSSDDEEENIQMYGMTPVPDAERFSADDDDLFMRSVLANYSTAGAVDKDQATACAKEVLCTHKNICGADLDAYLGTYFSKAWGHFDVNQTGGFEAIKMPQFLRFLASDQYFQFMFPKKA
jgi:hypothetical protein